MLWHKAQGAAGVSGGYTGPLGLTSSLDQISGNMYGGWRSRNVDISLYSGATVRPVFRYISGSGFRGDMQVDYIQIGGNSYSFESGVHSFQRNSNINASTYGAVSWQALNATLDGGKWSRDSGGTPSGSTGEASAGNGGYYVFFEASGLGYPSVNAWLRGPEIVLPSEPTMSYMEARTGSDIGLFNVYLDVIS